MPPDIDELPKPSENVGIEENENEFELFTLIKKTKKYEPNEC